MSREGYEILALLMRYVFLLLGVLIVYRAYVWLYKDHRAFQRTLSEQPQIGRIGEITDEKTGKTWPLYQEGLIGSGSGCDISVRRKGLRRKHAVYRLVPGKGVLVTPVRRARLSVDDVQPRKSALALSGSVLRLGNASLVLRLNPETGIPERTQIIPPSEDDESWMRLFEDGADPDGSDPLSPLNGSAVPGYPGADAFLPDQKERKKE